MATEIFGNGQTASQLGLRASDGAVGDAFGVSVAVRDGVLVVGAPGHSAPGVFRTGAAYVFTRSGNSWKECAKLTGDNVETEELFGYSVAVGSDTIAVGAIGDRDLAGAVYVFEWDQTNFVRKAKVTSDSLGQPYEELGYSTAMSGSTIVSGAPYVSTYNLLEHGAAYVYVRHATNWALEAKLMAGDLPPINPTGGSFYSEARFGWAVALDGDTAVIGAYRDDTHAGEDAGSAYVFARRGTNWSQEAKIMATGAAPFDRFGASVAINRDTILVGATQYLKPSGSNSGAAYVFVRSGRTWVQTAKLTVCDLGDQDFYGGEVAVHGDTAVVSAERKNTIGGVDAGAAYIFVREFFEWKRMDHVLASDGIASDLFGAAMAYDGRTLLVGAPYEFNAFVDTGLAYVYELAQPLGARVWATKHPAGSVALYSTGIPGCMYRFQRATSLRGEWTELPPVVTPQTGLVEYHDTNAPPSQAFYRCLQVNAVQNRF